MVKVNSIKSNIRNKYLVFGGLFLFILTSRLFFLGNGFGIDPDAWNLVLTTHKISSQHTYMVSRFPGYPIPECLLALLPLRGYYAINFITAISSALAVLLFVLVLKTLDLKKPVLTGVAMAFLPIIYIQSTTAMDYLWALAALMASLYFVLKYKPLLAGVFLGLAIGCRLTSGAMILPYTVLLYSQFKKNSQTLIKFYTSTLVITITVYLPVLYKYKLDFMQFYQRNFPDFLEIVYRATIDVWGILGVMGLGMGVFFIGFNFFSGKRRFGSLFKQKNQLAFLLAIILYFIAYLRLPQEAGYLIPAIPFILLLFSALLDKKQLGVLLFFFILSSFILGLDRVNIPNQRCSNFAFRFRIKDQIFTLDPLKGPILCHQSKRKALLHTLQQIDTITNSLESKSIIVTGWWSSYIKYSMPTSKNVKWIRLLDRDEVDNYKQQDYQIYYLPGVNKYNLYRKNGIDLAKCGAEPLIAADTNNFDHHVWKR